MWINDVEKTISTIVLDVKSVEFVIDCVVLSSAVTECERTIVSKICHPAFL